MGCRHGSCFPTSSSLRGCTLCKRPQRAGPNPPCCLYDDPRTYWHSVGEERGQGRRACIKNSPSSNTNCAFVGNTGKVQSPMSMNFSFNFYPISSKMRCWSFCLERPSPTCTITQLLRPHSKGTWSKTPPSSNITQDRRPIHSFLRCMKSGCSRCV